MTRPRRFGMTAAYLAAQKIEESAVNKIDNKAKEVFAKFAGKKNLNGRRFFGDPRKASAHNLRLAS